MIGIEIKNFQAIDDLTLRVEGFTALVGRSNIGKSSIVRALRCALSGSSGSDFVRHDAALCPRVVDGAKTCKCFASVKLTFGPGQAVLWEKGGRGVNRYTVWRDGIASVYDRVGQNAELPEFLDPQFAPAKLGPNATLLQVSSQFEAPFLLDLSGPAVASLLSDAGQLDEINLALTAVAKDRRADTATRKVREADVAGLEERLVAYADLDSHVERVRALQAEARAIGAHADRVKLADRLVQEVTESARVLRRVSSVVELKPPEVGPLAEAAGRLVRAHAFIEGWDQRTRAVMALRAALVALVPTPEGLLETSARYHKAWALEASLKLQEAVVARLAGLESLSVPTGLEGIGKRLGALRPIGKWVLALEALETSARKGARLQAAPVPEAPPLAAMLQRLVAAGRLKRRLEVLEREVAETERALEEATREARAVQTEFAALGVCPTCQQQIAPEHRAHVV